MFPQQAGQYDDCSSVEPDGHTRMGHATFWPRYHQECHDITGSKPAGSDRYNKTRHEHNTQKNERMKVFLIQSEAELVRNHEWEQYNSL